MSLIPAIDISASGLTAEKTRMEVIANNVANAETTRGPDGKVFRRREAIFAARLSDALEAEPEQDRLRGVEVRDILEDPRPPDRKYRPGHPDADSEGYVELPNISPIEEMVDMITASRAYEANLAAMKMAKEMATRALEIGKP
ncbi:MAG: flagellar basal body rod protein FlgC [Kiritimatiellae bacterium]|nr:flagellar basal body rod protein FlgC [Kiritimatiellia bacterium]